VILESKGKYTKVFLEKLDKVLGIFATYQQLLSNYTILYNQSKNLNSKKFSP